MGLQPQVCMEERPPEPKAAVVAAPRSHPSQGLVTSLETDTGPRHQAPSDLPPTSLAILKTTLIAC